MSQLGGKRAYAGRLGKDRSPPKGEVPGSPIGTVSNSRGFPPNVRRAFVLAKPNIDRVPQEAIGRPGQIGDLGDKLRLDPVHPRKNERRAEARAAGGVGC
jgi:hypothetical protein